MFHLFLLVQVFKSQFTLDLAGRTRQGGLNRPQVSPAPSRPSPSAHIAVSPLPEIVGIRFCLRQKQQWGQYFWSWFLLNKHGHQGFNQLNYWADYSIVSRSQCFLLFSCAKVRNSYIIPHVQSLLFAPSVRFPPSWWTFWSESFCVSNILKSAAKAQPVGIVSQCGTKPV